MDALHCRMQDLLRRNEGPPHGRSRGERGQSLIEFALFLPFVLLMMLVILDLAVAIDQKQALDHAIREGTRAASLGDTPAVVKARVVSQSDGLVTTGDVDVCYENIPGTATTGAGDFGDNIRVTITHSYTFAIGSELAGALGLGTAIDISPTAQDRLEKIAGVVVAPADVC